MAVCRYCCTTYNSPMRLSEHEDICEKRPLTAEDKAFETLGDMMEHREKKAREKKARESGGATNYYRIPDKAVMLTDLIRHKNMNHSEGEMFCAMYRLHDNGEYKRNLEKILHYAKSELDYLEERVSHGTDQ